MKIVSWNVNGLRSVCKKGFSDWLKNVNADIVCLQEIKIQHPLIDSAFPTPPSYQAYFNFAKKKGYGGIAVYTKKKPLKITQNLGLERFDEEGRLLTLEYPEFILLVIYMPHGGRQKENLCYKLATYKTLIKLLGSLKDKPVITVGDLNIAHQEIDLARPRNNLDNIMFTKEERKQVDQILNLGFVDAFRHLCKEEGYYTWWPYRVNARERNIGWRIDYIIISHALLPNLKDAFIQPKVTGSDHCPIGLDLDSTFLYKTFT